MRAYSPDLREHILYAVDQGKPRAEIIEMFHVSRATIKRYLKLRRETGEVKAKAIPGRPARKGAALRAGLPAQLDLYPDAPLAEHCQIWETTEASVSQFCDDEPCDPTPELDAQEEDVTSQRTEGRRPRSLARTRPNP